MGKNHRHQKRLKSEKAKTKLKNATKFLPKGQNVTKTDFKIKPIVLSSQLIAKTSDDGQRILNLKEVLSRLKHYNENMKIKACEDVEYILKNTDTDKLGTNIPEIIQSIASYIQLEMPKARKAGLNAITLYLKLFPEHKISPYFHYFSVNLRCAMTHIDRNIQEDSILFLDSLLTHVPALIAKHSSEIFPDFLNLVSKLKNDNQLKRTLTVNLKSKFSSIGWRILVFSRLYAFIEAIALMNAPKIDQDSDISRVTVYAEKYERQGIYKSSDALFNPQVKIIDIPSAVRENQSYIEKQFTVILPLLYESWLEGALAKPRANEVTYLTEEAGVLLRSVVKIFHLLWHHLELFEKNTKQRLTRPMEGEKLIVHLAHNLPYGLQNRPKEHLKQNKFLGIFTCNDMKCSQENLIICYIYLVWFSTNPSKAKQNHISKVIEYVSESLLRDHKDPRVDVSYLLLILKHLLIDRAKTWSKNKIAVDLILKNAITLYSDGNTNQHVKTEILKLLADINYEPLTLSDHYQLWLETLPELLCKPSIDENTIDLLFDLSRKNNVHFIKSLLNVFPLILKNLDHLRISHSETEAFSKLKIIDFLFYAPVHSNQLLVLLKSTLHKNSPFLPRLDYIINQRKEFHRD